MFTGIVEELGRLRSLEDRGDLRVLGIDAPRCGVGLALGDSIAVNGVCLTATGVALGDGGHGFTVETVPETLRRSNLGRLAVGDAVNLERSLTPSSRMGGHFVQGHVDAEGRIVGLEPEGASVLVRIDADPAVMAYVVPKGFIAVDGVSLTVVDLVEGQGFRIAYIPFTLAHTIAGTYRPGQRVNLEPDILGKYVERLIAARLAAMERTSS